MTFMSLLDRGKGEVGDADEKDDQDEIT